MFQHRVPSWPVRAVYAPEPRVNLPVPIPQPQATNWFVPKLNISFRWVVLAFLLLWEHVGRQVPFEIRPSVFFSQALSFSLEFLIQRGNQVRDDPRSVLKYIDPRELIQIGTSFCVPIFQMILISLSFVNDAVETYPWISLVLLIPLFKLVNRL